MSGWIPESERQTDYYIFNPIFPCQVPYLRLRSIEDVRAFGVPVSGHPDVDRNLAEHLVSTSLPISKMAELFANGAPVYLTNPEKDAPRIYDYVMDHLFAWSEVIRQSFNPGNVPLDDLRNLLAFAVALCPHAERHSNLGEVTSILQRNMQKTGLVPIHEFFKRKPAEKPKEDENKPATQTMRPEHKTMAEAFADRRTIVTGETTRW